MAVPARPFLARNNQNYQRLSGFSCQRLSPTVLTIRSTPALGRMCDFLPKFERRTLNTVPGTAFNLSAA
jgi:hypothetical protein